MTTIVIMISERSKSIAIIQLSILASVLLYLSREKTILDYRGRLVPRQARTKIWAAEMDYYCRKSTGYDTHNQGRIGKQCRERWHNHLNPDIKKEEWT